MNQTLKQLGYGEKDRVLIIHADDIGMCAATLSGLAELYAFGLVTSAAVMVPCPWFPHTAAFFQEHPTLDVGVHLTLNSEWTRYRWGPLSTRDPASGLLDAAGYFHPRPPATEQQARPASVGAELRQQLRQALAAGLDVTHVDAHMFTAARPAFRSEYVSLAREHRLPLLLTSGNPDGLGITAEMQADRPLIQELTAQGVPLFDNLLELPLNQPVGQLELARHLIDNLHPGLTLLLLHPAADTPELRALAPDWQSRVANAAVMRSPALRAAIHQAGVQLIGYRPLREHLRGQP